jgi:hypothetical protein
MKWTVDISLEFEAGNTIDAATEATQRIVDFLRDFTDDDPRSIINAVHPSENYEELP